MFDYSKHYEPVWPDELKPLNEGSFEKEPFDEWWGRHRRALSHLHPQIVEQWVHRHWHHSPFAFLPLESLSWEERAMFGDDILNAVWREHARELHPEFDYGVFQNAGGEKLPTAAALDRGTWDYPIIALSVPSGWKSVDAERPDVRLVLVEGHQRTRYLNALHVLGKAPQEKHRVFVISSPMVS